MARRTVGKVGLYAAGKPLIRWSVLVLATRSILVAGAALAIGSLVDSALVGDPVVVELGLLATLFTAAALLGWLWPVLADSTRSAVSIDLRARILGKVIDHPATPHRTGEVVTRATEGATAVGTLAGTFLPQLIGGMAIPILICGVVATIDWPTALLLLITIPAVPMLLRGMEKRFTSVTSRYWQTADRLTARFYDGIRGMKTLKALAASEGYGSHLEEDSERLRGETMALLRVNQIALLAVDSLFTLGTVVAASAAAMWRLEMGAISVGDSVALVLLGLSLIEPLSQIGRFFYVGAIGRSSAKDIESFLGETGMPYVARVGDGARVTIENVTFSYGSGRPALDEVSLHIEPGEVVGLVGPSGAGKSTLAGMISGLVEPDTGVVHVEGKVAVVSQQPYLFHGSLRDNLLLAEPGATDEELWAALEAVDMTDLVAGREEGLDLQVGERGLQLSGGEAQRLTIARMLLTEAPIVVLDEPTSNVDIETEGRVRSALERLTTGKTVVIIAHRRSTLARLDRIIVMAGGRIVADADPEELDGTAILDSMMVT